MTGPTPSPLPLSIETTCPRCKAAVVVSLTSVGAEATASNTLLFTPEYVARHRCADLPYDPWEHVPTPRSGDDL